MDGKVLGPLIQETPSFAFIIYHANGQKEYQPIYVDTKAKTALFLFVSTLGLS